MKNIKQKINKILELIKKRDLQQLEKYILTNKIELKSLNNKNFDLLTHIIDYNASYDIIEYIINSHVYDTYNYVFFDNETYYKYYHSNSKDENKKLYFLYKVPLFCAIINNNYLVADLLLKNKADINFKINNDDIKDIDILHYLCSKNNNNDFYLNSRNLKYLKHKGFYRNLYKDNAISETIENICTKTDRYLLENFLNYYVFDNYFILLLLSYYQYKKKISKRELNHIIKKRIGITELCYHNAIKSKFFNGLLILMKYDNRDSDIILNIIHKNEDTLKKFAYRNNGHFNFYFIQKILSLEKNLNKYNNLSKMLCCIIKDHTRKDIYIHSYFSNDINNDVEVLNLFLKTMINHKYNMENVFSHLLSNAISKENPDVLTFLFENYSNYIINDKSIDFENLIWTRINNDNFSHTLKVLIDGLYKNGLFNHEHINITKLLLDLYEEELISNSINSNKTYKIKLFIKAIFDYNLYDFTNTKFQNLLAKLSINYNNTYLKIDLYNKKYYECKYTGYNDNAQPWNKIILFIIENLLKITTNNMNEADVSLIKNYNKSCLNLILNTIILTNDINLLVLLLENKDLKPNIDINEKDSNNNYPIMMALKIGNNEIFGYLIDYGANFNMSIKSYIESSYYYNSMAFKMILNQNLLFHKFSKGNSNNLLQEAIYRNDINVVKLLIKKESEDINYNMPFQNKYGFSFLILSYLLNHEEIFHYLVNYMDINDSDNNDKTILHYAIIKDDVETIKFLIDNQIDINKTDYCETPLNIAILSKSKKAYNILLNNENLLINEVNMRSESTLMLLIKNHNYSMEEKLSMIKNLIQKGIDIDYINKKNGKSPLMYAIQERSLPMVKLLINHGANINYINKKCMYDSLFYAIFENDITIAEFILKNDVYIKRCSENNKRLILKYIITYKSIPWIKLLINTGLDLNDENNYSPLYYAIIRKSLSIVKFLVENGANVNHTYQYSESLLITAIKYADLNIIEYLIDQKATINFLNNQDFNEFNNILYKDSIKIKKLFNNKNINNNNSIRKIFYYFIQMMISYNDMSLLKFLVRNNIDVNIKNEDGNTPLIEAIKCGSLEIVNYLIENGANCNEINNQGKSVYEISYKYCNPNSINYNIRKKIHNIIKNHIE